MQKWKNKTPKNTFACYSKLQEKNVLWHTHTQAVVDSVLTAAY